MSNKNNFLYLTVYPSLNPFPQLCLHNLLTNKLIENQIHVMTPMNVTNDITLIKTEFLDIFI